MKFESGFSVTILAAMVATVMVMSVQAIPNPRIRSMRNYQSVSKRNGININNNLEGTTNPQPSCHESLICGFAYYDTTNRRVRPIVSFRKNNLCSCDDGYRCVLTGNMSDRKAYVFHCREELASRHMYEFPSNHYGG
jgi:hypothetical protein